MKNEGTISPALADAIQLLAESRADLERMVLEERIHHLETEVEALKQRLAELEKPPRRRTR